MDLDPEVSEAEPSTVKPSSVSFNDVFQNFALNHCNSVEATSSTEIGERSADKMNNASESPPSNCREPDTCDTVKVTDKCDTSAVTSTTCQSLPNTLVNKYNAPVNAEEVVDNIKSEVSWNKPVKRKRDDDDESSNTESLFNEDLLCQHG